MTASSDAKTATQDFKEHENQGNMTTPKDHTNLPITDLKDMEICDLRDKEFKINVLRKLVELQENTEKPFNEIRKTIQEQNEKFNRGTEKIKKNQANSGAEVYNE